MRLFVTRFLRALIVLTTILVGVALVLLALERMTISAVLWDRFLWIGPAAVVLCALLIAAVRRETSMSVARKVDEGAKLKEVLSTALSVEKNQDGWSRSVVETASTAAKTVRVSTAVPIQAPKHWPAPIIAAMAFFVVWVLMPTMDVLGKNAEAKKIELTEKDKQATKAKAAEAIAKVEQQLAKIDDGKSKDGKGDETKIDKSKELEGKTPEEIRRSAIKSLTDLKDRVQQAATTEKAQSTEAMMDKLAQLRTPGNGPLSDMANQLAKGNIADAKAALDKISKDLASGTMSAEDKAKLAEQLNKMASQLGQLAKDKAAVEQALEKAGLDKALANDPQKLAEALKNNQNMSEKQKQAMQDMAQAMKNANNACQNMGQCMSKMAEGMQQQAQSGQQGSKGQQGMSQEGSQAMESLAQQMDQMEAAAQDMASMQAAMSEANKQLQAMSENMGQCDSQGMGACDKGGLSGNGAFKNGESEGKNGAGRGGAGVSQGGGGAGEKAASEKWNKVKVKSQDGGGPSIGTMLIEGEQVKGESKAEFVNIAKNAEQEATEALENNVIERQYHDMVKHYFGRLAAKSQADADAAKKPDAKDGKPAADPKPEKK